MGPSYDRLTAPQTHTRRRRHGPIAGFPRSACVRPGPDRAPSIPRGKRCPASHRSIRGRRPPPLNGAIPAIPARAPDRNVVVTRHQQRFPDSRPFGPSPHLLPPSSGLAALGLSRELRTRTGQEPATHVTAGTGRTQTRSYVPGISQTSSRAHSQHATSCRNRGQRPPDALQALPIPGACSSAPV